MVLGWMRITVAPPKMQGATARHGGIRVASEYPDELWAGWVGLLERISEDELPDIFRVAVEP